MKEPRRHICLRMHKNELLIPDSVQKMIQDMTHFEGRRVFGDQWREIDIMHLRAYFGIVILAGVYRGVH